MLFLIPVTEVLMVEIPKVVHVLSCGFLLSLGVLCDVAGAESMAPGAEGKAGHSQKTYGQGEKELSIRQQGVHIIQGDVLRVEGDTYFIKELGGKELRLRADATTTKAEKIQVGDRIEAKVDENNRALSLLLAP
jgi:hypothetical protein